MDGDPWTLRQRELGHSDCGQLSVLGTSALWRASLSSGKEKRSFLHALPASGGLSGLPLSPPLPALYEGVRGEQSRAQGASTHFLSPSAFSLQQGGLPATLGIPEQAGSRTPSPLVQTAPGFLRSQKHSHLLSLPGPEASIPDRRFTRMSNHHLSYLKQNILKGLDGGPICNTGRRAEVLSASAFVSLPPPPPGALLKPAAPS